MRIAVGNDHTAVALKQHIQTYLEQKGYEIYNVGTDSTQRTDYPVYGQAVAKEVISGRCELGILICGTGIGISLAANKIHGIRAAVCSEPYSARLSRQHNNANIIAAGGTSSGKTTLLNAILKEISSTGDRLVIIEDTPELQCTAPNHVNLKTQKPYIDMNELLRMSLRISPRRIIVGEVRGKEALTMLKAWNTGHDGGCATLHSDSALESLYRLEQMVSEISITPQQRTISQAVDMVIYIKKEGTKRAIKEIIKINGYDHVNQEYKIDQIK